MVAIAPSQDKLVCIAWTGMDLECNAMGAYAIHITLNPDVPNKYAGSLFSWNEVMWMYSIG